MASNSLLRDAFPDSERGHMPCPKCGVNPSLPCEYGYWSEDTPLSASEFDCEYPWGDDPGGCEYCPLLWCKDCKEKFKDEFLSKTKTEETGEQPCRK